MSGKTSNTLPVLGRISATVNRLSTGAPKGRTMENATPANRKAGQKKYGSKLKAPPISKGKRDNLFERKIEKTLKKSGQ